MCIKDNQDERGAAACSDGEDNDLDGLVDCDDPSCAGVPACAEDSAEECADGSDNDWDGLADCDDPGCDGVGGCPCNVAPTGACQAGYYCLSGATTAAPTNGINGQQCPQGHYCPAGSTRQVGCPVGSFSASLGNAAVSDCTACTAGRYCPSTGQTSAVLQCAGGHLCTGGASVPSCARLLTIASVNRRPSVAGHSFIAIARPSFLSLLRTRRCVLPARH